MSRARDLADGTFSGAFSVDSPTLVVDDTNNRVGVGTASPSTALDVNGTVTTDALNVSAASPNIDVTDTGTSHASQDFLTNSSTVRATIGVERSTGGGLFVGSSAYAAVFGTASAGNAQFATNNNVRMTIDTSGRVTTPYQPAFHAYITGSNPGFNAGPTKVPYNGTRFNVGNNYDTTNQRFVAPVDGRYLFLNCLSTYYISAGLWFRNLWYVNGSSWKVGAYEVSADGNQDQQIESTLLIDLDANDYVEVWVQSSDTSFYMSAGTPYGAFSGYLVG